MIFLEKWRTQKLVLITTSNKPLGDPSSYRTIHLLNSVSKLFQWVIFNSLVLIPERESGLPNRQLRFRKGRSTANAEKAMKADKSSAVVTLDVKNAFNTTK